MVDWNTIMDEKEDYLENRYITFSLESEVYGIELCYVREIVSMQPITQMPELPPYLKGIINVRGKIIPVMDVRLRFGKEYKEYNDRTCIIIVDLRDMTLGLVVDKVVDVVKFSEEELAMPPETKKDGNKYIQKVGKVGAEVKLLLDCERLLNYKDIEYLDTLL